ncbi:ATP-binding protein [Limnobacter sp.]|uniref:ATP-binding protein n=1 Tax=Limnobacter sp. TaxID=2003368 RepID=UPI00351942A5
MIPNALRRKFSFLSLAALSGLAIAGLAFTLVWHHKQEGYALLKNNAANTAEITAARIESSLNDINTLLSILAQRYRDYPSKSQDTLYNLESQIRRELPFYQVALRIVVANAKGEQLLNTGKARDEQQNLPNLIDRKFYQRAIAGERGLMYEGPVPAKLDATWSIIMARPMVGSQGDFQGMVIAILPTERLGMGFEMAELGENGVINLRTDDLSQVVRYPPAQGDALGVGNKKVPTKVTELLGNSPDQHQLVFEAASQLDGIERLYVYQKLSTSPFWLSVGLSMQPFEAGWRQTGALVLALSGTVMGLLLWGARKLDHYSMGLEQQVEERTKRLSESEARHRELAQLAERSGQRLFKATRAASLGVWIWDLRDNTLIWDERMFELYGIPHLATSQAVDYGMWASRVHPNDLEMAESRVKNLLENKGLYDPEFRIILPDGSIRYIQANAFLERDELGAATHVVGLNQDVTLLRQSQVDLKEAQRIAKVGSWRFDINKQHVEWSEELYRMFGADPKGPALNLEQQAAIFTPESWQRLEPAIASAVEDGTPYEIELQFTRSDGSMGWMLARGERVLDANGQPVYLRGTASDITTLKHQEKLLQEARMAAEAANHAKSNFLSIMSHEIRTPLNAIIGTSYLLGLDGLTDTQRSDVATINASSKNLLALINDVLDFSKIEAGELELEQRPFQLQETLLDLRAMFTTLALQKGLTLRIADAPEQTPPVLNGDSNRLKQILINLLNNAIKFTDEGEVNLRISEYAPASPSTVYLRFEVSDTGIGIPQTAQAKLFTPFMQAEASTSRKYGGTGLGLSIVKRLAELIGGAVFVQSTPGQGTQFTVDLPFATHHGAIQHAPSALRIEPSALGNTTQTLKQVHVMVVDDSEINLAITKRILECEGATVTLCNGGHQALKKLAQHPDVDAILMDLQMPEMDGCETTLQIRKRLSADVPILALTAGATTTEKDRALASGMNGFLTKPVDPPALIQALRGQVDLHPQNPPEHNSAMNTTEPANDPWPKLPGIDLDHAKNITLGDANFFVELLNEFFEENASCLSQLEAMLGKQAWDEAARVAHHIAGQAGNLGATALYQAAKAMELGCKQKAVGLEPLLLELQRAYTELSGGLALASKYRLGTP